MATSLLRTASNALPPQAENDSTAAAASDSSSSAQPGQGLFISFEGIDGAGKSTHLAALAAAFRQAGRVVTVTREPGGTPLAEKIRTLVLADAMDPLTEALLVFAARRDHIARLIAPALARGEVVLCDRFTDASFAYQGGGRGLDHAVLRMLEAWVQGHAQASAGPADSETSDATLRPTASFHSEAPPALLQPDLTVWFDLDPAIAASRLAGTRAPDRFEAEPVEFFRRVAAAYAERRHSASGRFLRIDADQSPPRVWNDLHQHLVQRGWLA